MPCTDTASHPRRTQALRKSGIFLDQRSKRDTAADLNIGQNTLQGSNLDTYILLLNIVFQMREITVSRNETTQSIGQESVLFIFALGAQTVLEPKACIHSNYQGIFESEMDK